VPAEMIWTPDIVLYNKYSIQSTQFAHSTLLICSADGAYNITITNTKATLHYNGLVKWEPPAIFVSLCMIDVEWFPFDIQQCKLQVRVNPHQLSIFHFQFGSWTFHEDLLDLQHLEPKSGIIYKADDEISDSPRKSMDNVSLVVEGIGMGST
jgi:nicotinic acetylcholine receptor